MKIQKIQTDYYTKVYSNPILSLRSSLLIPDPPRTHPETEMRFKSFTARLSVLNECAP